jgi:hypothetical protein
MHTIHEKKEEFGHIILGIPRENILIFDTSNMLNMMDEFGGRDDTIPTPHDIPEVVPFDQNGGIVATGFENPLVFFRVQKCIEFVGMI